MHIKNNNPLSSPQEISEKKNKNEISLLLFKCLTNLRDFFNLAHVTYLLLVMQFGHTDCYWTFFQRNVEEGTF